MRIELKWGCAGVSRRRWAGMLCCAGCLLACGGSQTGKQPPARVAPPSDQLVTRAPQAQSASGQPPLGTLQLVAVPEQVEPRAAPGTPAATQPAPIRIDRAAVPEPVALDGRDLVLPGGLIIHGVPPSVTARTVREQRSQEPVLELVDKRGSRLALLKETSLTRVALPGGAPLLSATAATHIEATRDDWDKTPVRIEVDRLQSDTHLYVIERRTAGTDWIPGGLELSAHREGR